MKNNYLWIFFIAGIGISLMFIFLFFKYFPFAVYGLVDTCHGFITSIYHSTSTLITLLLLLSSLLIWKGYGLWRYQQQLTDLTSVTLDVSRHNLLARLLDSLKLKNKVLLFDSNLPIAFCAGLFKPKIYISTTLLKILSSIEVEAVLRHEKYHLTRYDPLAQTIGSWLATFSLIFPFISDLVSQYLVRRELQADQYVVQKMGTSAHIVSALKKLLQNDPLPNYALAASFSASDVLDIRITTLTTETKMITPQFNSMNILVTSVVFCLLLFLFVLPVKAVALLEADQRSVWMCRKDQCNNVCSGKTVTVESLEVNATYPFSPAFLNNQSNLP